VNQHHAIMRMAFFGPPGAGKGTQAARLTKLGNLRPISTGSLIRHAMNHHTKLGREAETYVSAGKLVPDTLVRRLAEDAIDAAGLDGFILDGYPRTLQQAEWLEEYLLDHDAPLDVAVSLKVPDERILQRLVYRRIHRVTGRTYHLVYDPPPLGVDSSLITQRRDDRPDAIKHRLESYRNDTEPVEAFFRERGILLEIDGVGSMNDVFDRLVGTLRRHGFLESRSVSSEVVEHFRETSAP
jgi:adenylate kinase